jgi:hypothetical protein
VGAVHHCSNAPPGVIEKLPGRSLQRWGVKGELTPLRANDDRGASRVVASLFQKYRDAGAPVEAHVFARGGHAFNMGDRSQLETLKHWPRRLADWMADNAILDPAKHP